MSDTVGAVLLSVLVLATSIWVGGYVAIVVVARSASASLEPGARVAFFRTLGRGYLWVGFPALLIALVTGGVLVRDHAWDGLLVTTVVVTTVLLASFGVAVVQARRMGRLRRNLLDDPDNGRLRQQVRRGARAAGSLRAVLGLLSIALVVLGSFLTV